MRGYTVVSPGERLSRDAPASARPDLFRYLDHRAFLGDWFAWKKATNRRYSHRAFARRAGQKSPSLLLLVTQGKRNLTAQTTAAFARAMALSPEETRFFTLLVQLDAAATDDERNAIFRRISSTRRFAAARALEGSAFRYLFHWYIPAVRELAACPGFRADPHWISQQLCPPITTAEARRAMDVLRQLGMVTLDDSGGPTVHDVSIVTPHEVAGLAVHNFHKAMLDRARDSIEGFPPTERQLGAVTVRVPTRCLPALKKAVAAFQDQFLDMADAMAEEAGETDALRVVQMNLQLFPLSAALPPPEPPPSTSLPDAPDPPVEP